MTGENKSEDEAKAMSWRGNSTVSRDSSREFETRHAIVWCCLVTVDFASRLVVFSSSSLLFSSITLPPLLVASSARTPTYLRASPLRTPTPESAPAHARHARSRLLLTSTPALCMLTRRRTHLNARIQTCMSHHARPHIAFTSAPTPLRPSPAIRASSTTTSPSTSLNAYARPPRRTINARWPPTSTPDACRLRRHLSRCSPTSTVAYSFGVRRPPGRPTPATLALLDVPFFHRPPILTLIPISMPAHLRTYTFL